MKMYKRMHYANAKGDKTPMQVLHTFLPELYITGFDRGRVRIFEEDSLVRINYIQKRDNKVRKLRSLLPFQNDNTPLAILLEINVKPDEHEPLLFHIYSNLERIESVAS